MKKIFFAFLILHSFSIFAQQKCNNEIGIKLGSSEYLFNNIYIDGEINRLYFYSSFESCKFEIRNLKNERNKYTYQKGFSIPEIIFRKRIYKRFWIANSLSSNYYVQKSDTAFGTYSNNSIGGEYFELYNHTYKTISFTPSIQYQWLNKRLLATFGVHYNFIYSNVITVDKGSYSGCFGMGTFDNNIQKKGWYSNSVCVSHNIKLPIYKNYYIGHEIYFNPFYETLYNSIIVCKMF